MARRRARRALRNAGVNISNDRAAGAAGGVVQSSGEFLSADMVLAATGSSAPAFLRSAGLSLDADGFISVDPFHRSVSHCNVFAAGDICSRDNPHFTRSGVHAVRAGPILANNLLEAIAGHPLKEYRPQKLVLYLLSCGEKQAIASWGHFSVTGGWVWRWKDQIDRRFVARFGR
jgi:NADH dehydrogenase FAD-containing subunit